MTARAAEHAAAGAVRDLRTLSENSWPGAATGDENRRFTSQSERSEYEQHSARYHSLPPDDFVPFRLSIVDGRVLDGPEHAASGDATACGIPSNRIFLMRRTFNPESAAACPACVAALRV